MKKFDDLVDPLSGKPVFEQDERWLLREDTRKLAPKSGESVERYVLALLYFAINGTFWDHQYNFLGPSSVCEWQGREPDTSIENSPLSEVTCEEEGSVSALRLRKCKDGELGHSESCQYSLFFYFLNFTLSFSIFKK